MFLKKVIFTLISFTNFTGELDARNTFIQEHPLVVGLASAALAGSAYYVYKKVSWYRLISKPAYELISMANNECAFVKTIFPEKFLNAILSLSQEELKADDMLRYNVEQHVLGVCSQHCTHPVTSMVSVLQDRVNDLAYFKKALQAKRAQFTPQDIYMYRGEVEETIENLDEKILLLNKVIQILESSLSYRCEKNEMYLDALRMQLHSQVLVR